MVSTRGAQPAVSSKSSPADETTMDQSAHQAVPNPPTSSSLGTPRENGAENIGSRLRKRRRTGSSPIGGATPTAKQAHRKQTPDAKRGNAVNSTQASHQRTRAKAQNTPQNTAPALSTALEESSHIQHATAAVPSLTEATAPDFNALIANIINHGETVDNHYASRGYDAMGMVDTASFLPQGASVHLKTQSLPILDNLATQILNLLAQSSYQEILTIATKPTSDSGHAYDTLKSLFNHTKKVYSAQESFLSPHELGLSENAHIDTIRKANMATFVSSVFGSQDVGFYHLNEYFLDTFVADGNRILKSQAQLYLDLKTQAYISAASNGERNREEILDDLFPSDLEQRLLSRRLNAKQLAPSELDFVQRARNRRNALLEEANTDESLAALPEKYIWEDFLRDIAAYVTKNFDSIAGDPPRKTSRSSRASNMLTGHQKQQQQALRRQQTQYGQQLSNDQDGQMQFSNETSNTQPAPALTTTDDIAEKAARAAHFAMDDYGDSPANSLPPQPPAHTPRRSKKTRAIQPVLQSPSRSQEATQTQQPQIQYHFENQLHPNVPAPPPPYFQHIPYQHPQMQTQWQSQSNGFGPFHPSYSEQNIIPYPTQSAPTQVLYERARMAASSKASPISLRVGGHPSQRRPWTADEENSLMAGLDRVKGPHWSQILAMFGPGGTINEVLKDRNQVQLKDKARNLKLFFLKSNIEVPYYLQFVTGELKTRAPAQAAKNEAKEKGISEEDRAHVQGVMALAGGSLQEGEQANPELEAEEGDETSGHLNTASDENNNNIDPSLEGGMATAMDAHTGNDTAVGMTPGGGTPGSIAPTAEMLTRRVEDFSASGNSLQDSDPEVGQMQSISPHLQAASHVVTQAPS